MTDVMDRMQALRRAWLDQAREAAAGPPRIAWWRGLGEVLSYLPAPPYQEASPELALELEQVRSQLERWPERIRRVDLVDTENQQEEPEDQGWTHLTLKARSYGWLPLARFLNATAERVVEYLNYGDFTRYLYPVITRWQLLGPSDPLWFGEALAQLPALKAIRFMASELLTTGWAHDPRAASEALSASPDLGRVEELILGGLPLPETTGRALSQGPLAASLRTLELAGSLAGQPDKAGWLSAWRPARLSWLGLSNNQLEDADAMALFESPLVQQLASLDLRGNRLTQSFSRWLHRTAFPPALQRLYLHGNPLSPSALAHIASWGHHVPGFEATLDQPQVPSDWD